MSLLANFLWLTTMKRIFKHLGFLVLAGCFFYGFIYLWSRVLKTDLLEEPLQYAPEIIEETIAVRDNRLGPEISYPSQSNNTS